MQKCEIIPVGLSEKNQLLKLTLSNKDDLFDSTASIIEGFRQQKAVQIQRFVSVLALDEIVHELSIESIDVIKIDIEGAELEALRGMLKTLRQFRPILIMEVLPSYTHENIDRVVRQEELAIILQNENYRIYPF